MRYKNKIVIGCLCAMGCEVLFGLSYVLKNIAITLVGVLITIFAAGVSTTFSVVGYAFLMIAVVSYALYSVFVEKASAFSEAEITYIIVYRSIYSSFNKS